MRLPLLPRVEAASRRLSWGRQEEGRRGQPRTPAGETHLPGPLVKAWRHGCRPADSRSAKRLPLLAHRCEGPQLARGGEAQKPARGQPLLAHHTPRGSDPTDPADSSDGTPRHTCNQCPALPETHSAFCRRATPASAAQPQTMVAARIVGESTTEAATVGPSP